MDRSIVEYWECTQEACRFRFPAFTGELSHVQCPRCRGEIRLALRASIPHESELPRSDHNSNTELLLDNIRSAWNVGSILRSADGAGINHVYLCGMSPTPEHPRVTRTSLGAEKHLSWSWHPNAVELAEHLLKQGKCLWAIEEKPDASPLRTVNLSEAHPPVVLVFGNELAGVDPELLRRSEKILSIPMRGEKRSLNVAVACGIALYGLLY